jgi:hypothetical protein
MDLLFKKLLESKVSFQTVSMSISRIVEHYPPVLQCWSAVLDRCIVRPFPLVARIREIVQWFASNGPCPYACLDFIKFLSEAKQTGVSKIGLFARILSVEGSNSPARQTARLLKFAINILPLLPASARQTLTFPPGNPPTFLSIIGLEAPRDNFVLPARVFDISAALQKRWRFRQPLRTKALPVKYTVSHNQSFIDIAHGGTAFVFNFMTKSTPVGHEGGPHAPHYHADAPPPTRDIHDLLERLEVLEHDHDAIMGFDEDTCYLSSHVDRAGRCVYGEAMWADLQPLLVDADCRRQVIARCRAALGRLEQEHFSGTQFVRQYLETQPTNAYMQSLVPPDFASGDFAFAATETDESRYMKGLITENTTAVHKNKDVVWFIQQVLPQFQVGLDANVLAPKSLVCALWYFGLLCDVVCVKDSVAAMSWDAVLDGASDTVAEAFPPGQGRLPRRMLTKALKSIITNRTIVDENADEIGKHLGLLASDVAHFYPIYAQLNRACTWLRADPHLPAILRCARLFGRRDAYRSVYERATRFPAGGRMFKMTIDAERNRVAVGRIVGQ